MKYFTKEWYRAALAEEQQRAAGGKLKFNKKPDNAMRDYQRALSKIQSKLPACVCKTFHGSVITDVAARQDQVVLYFDNSESFSCPMWRSWYCTTQILLAARATRWARPGFTRK